MENADWREVLRQLLGEEGAERALEAMREAGLDPDTMSQAADLPVDPGQLQNIMAHIGAMLQSSGDGPVNWQLARDIANQQVHSGGDPMVSAAQAARIRTHLQAADLWLDSVTDLVGPVEHLGALTRTQWVAQAIPTFQQLAEPVAANVERAVSDVLSAQLGDEGQIVDVQIDGFQIPGLGIEGMDAKSLMRKMGGAGFGFQLGSAVAALAKEAFGLSDLGIPLAATPTAALVPSNIDAFADGLDIPSDEIASFLAVREVALARLYASSPWLAGHVIGLITNYAREISIDLDAMEQAMREIDPQDPEQIRDVMGSGIFSPNVSPSQKETLESLETTLAIIEGWVEHVTSQATIGVVPHAIALTELMRRRRASGGPAEDTFASLVGLELRPRRIREAVALWELLTRELGSERDSYLSHPDLMPTAADLDDPSAMIASRSVQDEMDAALEDLLASAQEATPADSADEAISAAGDSPADDDGAVGSSDEPSDGEADSDGESDR